MRIAILTLSLLLASFAAQARRTADDESGPRSGRLVDINHASLAELKTLPGIRDAYAAAIVKGRPYKNKRQILSRQVIPEAAYGKIKSKIVAKQ